MGKTQKNSLEVPALDCTDNALLLSPDGLEAAAPVARSPEALVLQGRVFTGTWLLTGRALPLGCSSVLTATTAEASGEDAVLVLKCTA